MFPDLILAPRYRLDDELPWLVGIDPSRHYWLQVNGDAAQAVAVAGLAPASQAEFKAAILRFRAMQPGEAMQLVRPVGCHTLCCVSENCYALEAEHEGGLVWHLFDRETIESLLMTAHPDWQCAPQDLDLGRRALERAWRQAVAA